MCFIDCCFGLQGLKLVSEVSVWYSKCDFEVKNLQRSTTCNLQRNPYVAILARPRLVAFPRQGDMLATMSQHWKCRQCNTAWVEGRWTRSRRGLWYCNTCWPRESTPTIKSGDRTVGFGAYANFTYNEVLRVDPDWCGFGALRDALVTPRCVRLSRRHMQRSSGAGTPGHDAFAEGLASVG